MQRELDEIDDEIEGNAKGFYVEDETPGLEEEDKIMKKKSGKNNDTIITRIMQ